MDDPRQDLLRTLPAIGELLDRPDLRPDHARPRWALLEAARAVIADARASLLAGRSLPSLDQLAASVRDRAADLARPRLHRVVNATGVVIHTNLGRAPLSEAALERVIEVARSYSNLEYDLEKGARGSRHGIVDETLCRLTGAQAAMVVNNNAAAVLLALSALASGREVIVSRGELIEIGGSFRIPDILLQSGCRLREVGTTNRTRLADYERAITPDTAVLLKVHPSNFRVIGFTEAVDGAELSALGRAQGVHVIEDLGSGCLVDLSTDGLTGEPTAARRIDAGIDLVTMSGDKLLGGPQAGILVGRADLIAACRAHPLARALRIDKLSLAALEGTLAAYRDERERYQVPVVEMLTRPLAQLEREAAALRDQIDAVAPGLTAQVVRESSRVGGGAFPELEVPTAAVALQGDSRALADWLRRQYPPIIARVRDDVVLLDPRTLLPGDAEAIVEALRRLVASSA